jgi:hypothetical protein
MMAKNIYTVTRTKKKINKFACRYCCCPQRLATAGSLELTNQRRTKVEIEFVHPKLEPTLETGSPLVSNVQTPAGPLTDCTA